MRGSRKGLIYGGEVSYYMQWHIGSCSGHSGSSLHTLSQSQDSRKLTTHTFCGRGGTTKLNPWQSKTCISYRNTKVSGALAAPDEVAASMEITGFCEIRGISWNSMEIHRIPRKCVKSVISVKFQISSETHLRNTKKWLRL